MSSRNDAMSVLFCNTGMLDVPNGAFWRSITLAEELSKEGMNVTFLTTLPVEKQKELSRRPTLKNQIRGKWQGPFFFRETRNGVKIIAAAGMTPQKIRKFGYDPLALILRIYIALNQKYDVVHADGHRPSVFLPAMIQKWIHQAWFISEWWDLYGKGGHYENKQKIWKWTVGGLDNLLEKLTHKTSDRLIVVSEELRRKAVKLGRNQQHIKKVWGASDVSGIEFTRNPITNRKKFGLPEDAIILMASGMHSEELSASDHLFKVMVELKEEILRTKKQKEVNLEHSSHKYVSLIFINITSPKHKNTIPESGTLESEWLTPFIDKGVVQSIACVKYADYGALLSCADAFVLLQKNSLKNRSRWPNCIGDFMAAGRPIICNPIGEIANIMESWHFVTIPVQDIKSPTEFYRVLKNFWLSSQSISPECIPSNQISSNQNRSIVSSNDDKIADNNKKYPKDFCKSRLYTNEYTEDVTVRNPYLKSNSNEKKVINCNTGKDVSLHESSLTREVLFEQIRRAAEEEFTWKERMEILKPLYMESSVKSKG